MVTSDERERSNTDPEDLFPTGRSKTENALKGRTFNDLVDFIHGEGPALSLPWYQDSGSVSLPGVVQFNRPCPTTVFVGDRPDVRELMGSSTLGSADCLPPPVVQPAAVERFFRGYGVATGFGSRPPSWETRFCSVASALYSELTDMLDKGFSAVERCLGAGEVFQAVPALLYTLLFPVAAACQAFFGVKGYPLSDPPSRGVCSFGRLLTFPIYIPTVFLCFLVSALWYLVIVFFCLAALPFSAARNLLDLLKSYARGRSADGWRQALMVYDDVLRVSVADASGRRSHPSLPFVESLKCYAGISPSSAVDCYGEGIVALSLTLAEGGLSALMGNSLTSPDGRGAWVAGPTLLSMCSELGEINVSNLLPWALGVAKIAGGTREGLMVASNLAGRTSFFDTRISPIARKLNQMGPTRARYSVSGVQIESRGRWVEASKRCCISGGGGFAVAPGSLASYRGGACLGDRWTILMVDNVRDTSIEKGLQILGVLNTISIMLFVVASPDQRAVSIFLANLVGELTAAAVVAINWFLTGFVTGMDVLDPFHAILKWPPQGEALAVFTIVSEALCGMVGAAAFAVSEGGSAAATTYAALVAAVFIPAVLGGIWDRRALVVGCLAAYAIEMAAEAVILANSGSSFLVRIALIASVAETCELLIISSLIVFSFRSGAGTDNDDISVYEAMDKFAVRREWTVALGIHAEIGRGILSSVDRVSSTKSVPDGLGDHSSSAEEVIFHSSYSGKSWHDQSSNCFDGGLLVYGVGGESCSAHVFGDVGTFTGSTAFTFKIVSGELVPNLCRRTVPRADATRRVTSRRVPKPCRSSSPSIASRIPEGGDS